MYKMLLCWRYLRTRYIAMASIISVMLGVATMIVVNAVMSGFATEMEDRIQGVLSDVTVDARSADGFPDAEGHMARIMEVCGDDIEGMTPTVVVPAAICFDMPGSESSIIQQIRLVGVDAKTVNKVGDFAQFLQHPANRRQVSFELKEGGYDVRNWQAGDDGIERPNLKFGGWQHRREMAEMKKFEAELKQRDQEMYHGSSDPAVTSTAPTEATSAEAIGSPANGTDPNTTAGPPTDMFSSGRPTSLFPGDDQIMEEGSTIFDPATDQHTGLIMGISLASCRMTDPETGELYEWMPVIPGDDVTLGIPTTGMPPKFEDDYFTVVDFYESKMSEFDSSFVFIPLEKLQDLRGMIDPQTGERYVSRILINVKDGVDINTVRDKIRNILPEKYYQVQTWRDSRSDMLAAVHFERMVLNVLLFLIIAVAGFGILAIFFMIVLEKTKDVGILKSLGASATGIMQIFVGYGLALGLLGSGIGMIGGLLFVHYIDRIADFLSWVVGFEVFNPEIYYFYKIPTVVYPSTVAGIVFGAVLIAVLASVLPAIRAARMHPVEALRYE